MMQPDMAAGAPQVVAQPQQGVPNAGGPMPSRMPPHASTGRAGGLGRVQA
jgi:hypothetical protein